MDLDNFAMFLLEKYRFGHVLAWFDRMNEIHFLIDASGAPTDPNPGARILAPLASIKKLIKESIGSIVPRLSVAKKLKNGGGEAQ